MTLPNHSLAGPYQMGQHAPVTAVDVLPTGTVTLLLTDIEGSTRLWEGDEVVAAAAIARHYELLEAAVELHGGVRPVEQGEGDSVVAAFTKPSNALAAALDLQRAFLEELWPETAIVRIRIALHTGEIDLRDAGNYQGPTIIRCARLRNATHGGQTVLSSTTHDLVVDHLPDGVVLRDLGAHRFKGLGRAERVWQLCHPDLGDAFPPLRSLDSLPNNLPVQLTTFVARDGELAELAELIQRNRLVTLTGTGGCGKTRLALQSAADAANRHTGGVWWVELAPVRDPELVAAAVAEAVGLREEHDRPLIDTLVEQLRGRGALLVLDNCEQVLDGTARLLNTLLVGAPDLHVVATSREPLGVPGEIGWRVPSLDEASALALFVDRARQARPGFSPDDEQLEAVARICRRLDGLPLALELAAARVRVMHPNRIAVGLDDRFRLLTGGSRGVMARQQTLEASVAWSHNLLDEHERAVLRRLSVFPGGFTLDAAEAVAADELVDPYEILDLLARLVDKSLVQLDDDERTDTRYRLLETIRQYARERLVESGETNATLERHLTHFLALAEHAEPELHRAGGRTWLAHLEADHDNFRTALEWADTSDDHERFLRLVTALTLFWELRGHLPAGARWFARALAADDVPSVMRARALWGAAHVALYSDDFETAMQRAPEALAMAEALGDQWTTARALNTSGYAQLWFDPAGARDALKTSVDLGRAIGDDWAVADGLKMITVAWLVQDDHEGLSHALDDLAGIATHLDNRFFTAWYHCGLGYSGLRRGELDTARREFEASLDDCRDVGDPATASIAIAYLGELEVLTGLHDAARERLETFLAHAGATGGGMGVPFALIQLATLMLGCGDATGARALVDPLIDSLRADSIAFYLAAALSVQGAAHLATGDAPAARSVLEEADEVASGTENPWLVAMTQHGLAALARSEGEFGDAEDLQHAALARCHHAGLLPQVVTSLEALAALALEHESATEATRLFGAAATLRSTIGTVRWPMDQTVYDVDVARAQDQLGLDTFRTLWAEGTALSVDDAVAYASRARGERKRPSAGWASLTPTEERVVALAAEGLTNSQIAERLFVAPGTIKVHLGHIFTKLGVATRAELAGTATRRSIERSHRRGPETMQ
jgi:predicted ATPase/class 3 adenylate cyclase/DNA-binding CsgD family transcriptional regulator